MLSAWNGTDLRSLTQVLTGVAQGVTLTAERHRAFPVLHYFFSDEREAAFPPSLAVLDEALTLLQVAVDQGVAPDEVVRRQARGATGRLIDVVRHDFGAGPATDLPPPPSVDRLAAAGVPLRPRAEREAGLQAMADRRRALLAYVQHTGWGWEDVVAHPCGLDA